MRKRSRGRGRGGFTLIEVIMAMTIIATAMMMAPRINSGWHIRAGTLIAGTWLVTS